MHIFSKNNIILFIIGFLIVTLFFYFSDVFSESQQMTPETEYTSTHNRKVYDVEYKENSVIDELNKTVYRGMSMDANEEHFFISDFGDYYVKMFNSDGSYNKNIGNGQGRGPGEFQNISNISPTDKHLWTADMQSLRLNRFSLDNSEDVLEIKVERRPTRVAANDSIAVVKWLLTEQLFSVFDNEGNELFKFGEIEEAQDDPFSFDGWIELTEQYLIFVPMNVGIIYVYDVSDGSLVGKIETPHFSTIAASEEQIDGNRRRVIAPTSQYTSGTPTALPGTSRLIVETLYRGDEIDDEEYDASTADFWLDIYDLNDLSYVHSIQLPHAVSSFVIHNGSFITYNSTSGRGISYDMTDELKDLIYP
jgi:hypothetical protein